MPLARVTTVPSDFASSLPEVRMKTPSRQGYSRAQWGPAKCPCRRLRCPEAVSFSYGQGASLQHRPSLGQEVALSSSGHGEHGMASPEPSGQFS